MLAGWPLPARQAQAEPSYARTGLQALGDVIEVVRVGGRKPCDLGHTVILETGRRAPRSVLDHRD